MRVPAPFALPPSNLQKGTILLFAGVGAFTQCRRQRMFVDIRYLAIARASTTSMCSRIMRASPPPHRDVAHRIDYALCVIPWRGPDLRTGFRLCFESGEEAALLSLSAAAHRSWKWRHSTRWNKRAACANFLRESTKVSRPSGHMVNSCGTDYQ